MICRTFCRKSVSHAARFRLRRKLPCEVSCLRKRNDEASKESKILRAVADSDLVSIFLEHRIQHPVQTVFDAPMTANSRRKSLYFRRYAQDVISDLDGHLAIALESSGIALISFDFLVDRDLSKRYPVGARPSAHRMQRSMFLSPQPRGVFPSIGTKRNSPA